MLFLASSEFHKLLISEMMPEGNLLCSSHSCLGGLNSSLKITPFHSQHEMRKSCKISNSSSEMFNVFKWKQLVSTNLKFLRSLGTDSGNRHKTWIFFPFPWYITIILPCLSLKTLQKCYSFSHYLATIIIMIDGHYRPGTQQLALCTLCSKQSWKI